jgi:hypothetical protein
MSPHLSPTFFLLESTILIYISKKSVANKYTENVAKYLWRTVTNQNCFHEDID